MLLQNTFNSRAVTRRWSDAENCYFATGNVNHGRRLRATSCKTEPCLKLNSFQLSFKHYTKKRKSLKVRPSMAKRIWRKLPFGLKKGRKRIVWVKGNNNLCSTSQKRYCCIWWLWIVSQFRITTILSGWNSLWEQKLSNRCGYVVFF